MNRNVAKSLAALLFMPVVFAACMGRSAGEYSLSESKEYGASLFRQNCAICHGPEGNGKTIDDGTVVPSLRTGEFKFKTEEEIYKQIAEGGHGMLPFRNQLTERELRMLTDLVRNKLRRNEVK
jgi:mono/diheme cytochrome c family protein